MRRPLAVLETSVVGSTPIRRRLPAARGFTLVELLTVVFIISLLIAVLVPALSSARSAAKKAVSQQGLKAIGVGLESFRNDNGTDFVQTNGYPPSFVHPPIWGSGPPGPEALNKGAFPFVKDYPVAYGAHWLPAMLMGIDNRGYIKPNVVPKDIVSKPEKWYTTDPTGTGKIISRVDPYCSSENLRTVLTKDLPGQPSGDKFFADRLLWNDSTVMSVGRLPVIVDGFDYPVLYYVANKNGRPTNMVAEAHDKDNDYPGNTPQTQGVPYYFHDDNVGFTGRDKDDDLANGVDDPGWEFNGPHGISFSGAELDAQVLVQEKDHRLNGSFARFILDRKQHRDLRLQAATANQATPLRPVNADSYILWSPGADGRWGTNDDVSNVPPFVD